MCLPRGPFPHLGVNGDDGRPCLSTRSRSQQQRAENEQKRHRRFPDISPHGRTPCSNYVDTGLGNFSMASSVVTRDVVVEASARYGKNVNRVALQKGPHFL